jgi:hypothetical protein
MEEGSITVLVDAKEEYTKQLISILKQCIYQGIKSIYLDAKDICNQDNTPEKVLMVFQDLLSRIPKWSQDIINKEYERILNVSKCDYIEDLLKVVYVSHIKVLTIVHSAQKNKKISLKIPNCGHFIHLCYIECAREFWKDPYLFSENVNKYELQKNMRDSEIMIAECIAETIRKQLPVRHILKEFLNEPDEDIEEADEDIKEPINKKYMKKLETVIKKELKTSTKGGNEIDIDLIRKVIKEELANRPEITTNVIKKDLVEIVVEKIVEQAPKKADKTNTEEPKKDDDKAADSKADNSKPDNSKLDDGKLDDSKLNDGKADDSKLDDSKLNDGKADDGKPDNSKADGKADDGKPDNGKADDNKSSENNDEEESSNNIDDLINELEISGDNIKIVNDVFIDNSTENVNENKKKTVRIVNNNEGDNKEDDNKEDDNKEDDNKEGNNKVDISKSKLQNNKLQISNIDEINLNLDELDSETENDLELEEVNIKKTDEVKKDPNSKYIFFNDVE